MGTLCCHLMDTRALGQDNPSQRLQKAGAECPPLNTCLVNSYVCFTCLGNLSQRKLRGESGCVGQHSGAPLVKSLPAGQRVGLLGQECTLLALAVSQISPSSLLWVSSLSSHPPCRGRYGQWARGLLPSAVSVSRKPPQAFSEHLLRRCSYLEGARLGRLRSSGCSKFPLCLQGAACHSEAETHPWFPSHPV